MSNAKTDSHRTPSAGPAGTPTERPAAGPPGKNGEARRPDRLLPPPAHDQEEYALEEEANAHQEGGE